MARALSARGVAADQGADFLKPTLKALFPDPSSFMDMDAAAAAIIDALQAQASVHVFADYDVDGASSAALLVRWFRALGADLPIYVPDRLTEGYGPSARAFDTLKARGADLVITVDCGAAANEAVAHAASIGLKVVVIDHHMMREEPPACLAVVNPNRPGCNSGQGNLAAAGVVFVLLAALNREARGRGLFEGKAEPDIRQWLDLAAMGAICDVTGLTGFNRALTSLGLGVMSHWRNPGLRALLAAAGAEPGPAKTNHAGFILGPRINAGGRIGKSDLGARLLSTDDPDEARMLAQELDTLNLARREVEAEVTEQAVRRVEATGAHADDSAAVVVSGEDWHPGVVGIVAGRLRERWRKPVIVIGVDAVNGVGKGSGLSQPGMNLGRAVQEAWNEGLLIAGGGHAMAAGPVGARHEPGPGGAGGLERGPADRGRRPRHGGGADGGGRPHRRAARLSQRPPVGRARRGRGPGLGRGRRPDRPARRHPRPLRSFRATGALRSRQPRAPVCAGRGAGARAGRHERRPCAVPPGRSGRRLGAGHRLALRRPADGQGAAGGAGRSEPGRTPEGR